MTYPTENQFFCNVARLGVEVLLGKDQLKSQPVNPLLGSPIGVAPGKRGRGGKLETSNRRSGGHSED
jgi:hypothetical protein